MTTLAFMRGSIKYDDGVVVLAPSREQLIDEAALTVLTPEEIRLLAKYPDHDFSRLWIGLIAKEFCRANPPPPSPQAIVNRWLSAAIASCPMCGHEIDDEPDYASDDYEEWDRLD